jgi:Fe-S-cluster containining protein
MKECNQCGKCCIKYGDGALSASQEDIDMWELFNPDIFQYVKGKEIWFDPTSGAKLSVCPFLELIPQAKPNAPLRYTCGIYLDRPEDCRIYPSLISEMIDDECEMIEISDLGQPKQAQIALDKLMKDSR